MKTMLAALTLCVAGSCLAAPPFELHGFRVGTLRSELQNLGQFDCTKLGARLETCIQRDSVQFGGYYAKVMLTFLDGVCARVAVNTNSDDFLALKSAFTAKYGQPIHNQTSELETLAGAHVENHIVGWEREGTGLRLMEYDGDIRHSEVDISVMSKIADLENAISAGQASEYADHL